MRFLRNFKLNVNLDGLADDDYLTFGNFIVEGLDQNETAKYTLIIDDSSFELQSENSEIIFSGSTGKNYSGKNIEFEIKNHNIKERKELFIEYFNPEDIVQKFFKRVFNPII